MKKGISVLLSVFVSMLMMSTVYAAESIPRVIHKQYVVNNTAAKSCTFTIIDALGTQVWGPTTVSLSVWQDQKGNNWVSYDLDLTSVIDGGTMDLLNQNYWLDATIAGVSIAREKLVAAPYAIQALDSAYADQAANADTVDGLHATDLVGQQGPQGIQGETGAKGDKGDKGDPGADGAAGAKGDKGDKGDTGAAGTNGTNGINGADGTNGTNGVNGADGTNGTNGVDGKTVLNGILDPTAEGIDGDFYINTASNTMFGPKAEGAWPTTGVSLVGPKGADGTNGTNGADGAAGAKGDKGDKGDTGAAGTNGTNGADGAAGAKGDKGDKGDTGAAGTNGTNGINGADGAPGPQGDPGIQGETGPQGVPGTISWDDAAGVVTTTQKVGIGTSSPSGNSLHVYAADVATLYDILGNNQVAGSGFDIQTANGTPPSGPIQAINGEFLIKYNPGTTISNNFNTFRMIARTDSSVSSPLTGALVAGNFIAQHKGSNTASIVTALASNIALQGTGNVTGGSAIRAASPNRSGSGTITNAYGIDILAQKVTGVTNGYGVFQEGASDINYFAGNVGIGTTAPSQKLEVNGNVSFGGGSANHAVCWKSDGKTLGHCSSAVASDGSCTCE